jgi:hypothetical protein
MGAVYLAHDERLGRPVALKKIRPERLSAWHRSLFEREARALARLQHPHIVQVHAWYEDQDGPVMVLEYIAGGSLENRLKERLPTLAESARLVAVLARAVQAAHDAGVIHRDLKPGNVLMANPVEGSGDNVLGGYPKIADFGLARLVDPDASGTATGTVMGTPEYMAPEQAEGRTEHIGPATDVWALGVILYRCLTGRLPFTGGSTLEVLERIRTRPPCPLGERLTGIPAELEGVCLGCLEKDPARRPTAGALACRLEQLRFEEMAGDWPSTVSAISAGQDTREGTTARAPKTAPTAPERKRRLGGWLPAALVPMAAAAALFVWWRQPSPETGQPVPVENGQSVKDEKPVTADLRLLHFPKGEVQEKPGRIGDDVTGCAFGDGVRIEVKLSRPAQAFLLSIDSDGKEQLLWPVEEKDEADPERPSTRTKTIRYPTDPESAFVLNEHKTAGMQVFALVVSGKPLPSYTEWRRRRKPLSWRKQPPRDGVWAADREGTYPVRAGAIERGVQKLKGLLPLAGLCRDLARGIDAEVEAIAFPVQAKGGK